MMARQVEHDVHDDELSAVLREWCGTVGKTIWFWFGWAALV